MIQSLRNFSYFSIRQKILMFTDLLPKQFWDCCKIYNYKIQNMRAILLLIFAYLAFSTQIHEVIIIGAGVSGIAASLELTKNNVPHLMLEARNRIGGRIATGTFENTTVETGATFVHQPNKTNPIVDIMKQLNLTANSARFNDQAFYYENQGLISERYKDVSSVFQDLMSAHIRLKAKMNPTDLSIKEAAEGFFKNVMSKQKQVYRDLVNWQLQSYGNAQGAEISQLSARQLQYDESPYDMIPTIGYPKVIEIIFKQCKPDLRLNEEVIQIDYSRQIVKVTTKKGVYYGKKVISSLPLGVIQAKKVKFVPALPLDYSLALFHLAPGINNKLFVSFEQPFWKPKSKWINFVKKNQKRNKYSVAAVWPIPNKHVLVFFLSGQTNKQLSKLSENHLKKDLLRFLCPFIEQDLKINEIYMTKWHEDEYSLGSYTYYPVGAKRSAIQHLRKPVQNKLWFVGEHAHPYLKSLVQGAYLTGQYAAWQILNQERTRLVMRKFQ